MILDGLHAQAVDKLGRTVRRAPEMQHETPEFPSLSSLKLEAPSTKNGLYEGTSHGKSSSLNLSIFFMVYLIPPTTYVTLNAYTIHDIL